MSQNSPRILRARLLLTGSSKYGTLAIGGGMLVGTGARRRVLRRKQRIHATLTLVIPFLGVVGGIIHVTFYGIAWFDLLASAVGYTLTMIGVGVGFHRYFSHRSFDASPLTSCVLGILGSTA